MRVFLWWFIPIFLEIFPYFSYIKAMVTNLARQAMTTNGQKACLIIDHLVEALANDASSSLRRAMILSVIDLYPGTTQTGIMERLGLHKSAVNREVEWLFNYGCVMVADCDQDGRSKKIQICGYSKAALDHALSFVGGSHQTLQELLIGLSRFLKQEKPTLREAKIISSLFEKKGAEKNEVIKDLYDGSPSTKNRVVNKLIEDGIISDG